MPISSEKNKENGQGVAKWMRMAGLACSVGFEFAAGPFAGYFVGTYLSQRFGWGSLAVAISVFIGFLGGFYAVMLTVRRINEIDRKSPED